MANRIKLVPAGVSELLHSQELADYLMERTEPVAAAARSDQNAEYASGVRHYVHDGPSRVSARVGAAPGIGMAVEAKRGTLARGLGNA